MKRMHPKLFVYLASCVCLSRVAIGVHDAALRIGMLYIGGDREIKHLSIMIEEANGFCLTSEIALLYFMTGKPGFAIDAVFILFEALQL